jgi:DNA-binding response OmpR family regulator
VLVAAGASPADAAWLNQRARGHALSLQLMAAALPARGAGEGDELAATAADELARTYLDALDPATREALDAASVTRRTTLALLGAMLPHRPAAESLARLRALPFVELSRDGYIVHDTVRATVAALLRAGDPARLRAHRAAAWRVARAELRRAAPADAFRAIADVLYLVDEPLVRDFFFTASQNDHAVQRAAPDDWPAIRSLAEQWRECGATERLEAWWRLLPSAFAVARDGQGEVSAFRCVTDARAVTAELAALDPLVGRWRAHERTDPVGRGDVVVYERFLCAREDCELAPGHRVPSAGRAALLLDLKRLAVELRPHLRRVYASQPIVDTAYGLCALALGYEAMPGERAGRDGIPYASMMLELGPGSVDGWLAAVASRLLMVEAEGPFDPATRELVLDGARTPLTPLELGVLRVLCAHEGRVVSRAELRRQVWGHEWNGGANVVDVVVSALRRKLGDRAGSLETVRGVGWRMGSLA